MRVHLIDGTYELFRQHFGYAKRQKRPTPYDATVGVLSSTLQLLQDGATHVAVASDHVIESFRNDLWAGYKTSAGMDPVLLAQLPIMEDALEAMGVTVWAMVEYEADDALAAAALVAGGDERVTQVVIVTPDKDLGQCVRGARIVQYDRRNDTLIDEVGVLASSACHQPRCRTGWLWSATAPTATRESQGGEQRRRLRCWLATAPSIRFPTTSLSGTCAGFAVRRGSRRPSAMRVKWRGCSSAWRPL